MGIFLFASLATEYGSTCLTGEFPTPRWSRASKAQIQQGRDEVQAFSVKMTQQLFLSRGKDEFLCRSTFIPNAFGLAATGTHHIASAARFADSIRQQRPNFCDERGRGKCRRGLAVLHAYDSYAPVVNSKINRYETALDECTADGTLTEQIVVGRVNHPKRIHGVHLNRQNDERIPLPLRRTPLDPLSSRCINVRLHLTVSRVLRKSPCAASVRLPVFAVSHASTDPCLSCCIKRMALSMDPSM